MKWYFRAVSFSARRNKTTKTRQPLRVESLEARDVPATHTWTGAGGNALWSTVANWDPSTGAPTAAEGAAANVDVKLIFPAVVNKSTNQDIANLIVDQLQFQADGFTTVIAQTLTIRQGFDPNNPTQSNISCTAGFTNTISGGTITTPAGKSLDITVNGGSALTISTVIAGTGAGSGFSKTGAGTLTLSGVNTFGGGAGVNSGTLVVKNAAALGTTAAGTGIDEGATLDVQADIGTEPISANTDNNTPSLGNFLITSTGTGRVGGPVTLNFGSNNEVLTVGGAGNLTIASIISGPGNGVTKTGAGTTTLSGASTYSGTTTVSAGILQVNGSQGSSAVSVTGGTLGGSGVVGAITTTTGATVAPGLTTATTPITLTTSGNVTLTGSTFAPVISGTLGGASDKLAVVGTVNLTGATLAVTRNGAGVPINQAVRLIDNDAADPITGTFTGLAQGATVLVGGQNFTIIYTGGDGNDVVLTALTAPVVLAPTTLPNGVVGTAYNQTITASGPAGPFTFAVTTGTLPAGLTLTAAGALTGTPTADATSTFTVTATNAATLSGSQAYTLTVTAVPVVLAPTTLPNGIVGTAYNQTITASGPAGPFTFAVTTGTLPAGLTLTAAGALTGTPTAAAASTFTVTATSPANLTGSLAYTLTVTAVPVVVSPIALPNGAVGTAYNQTITATGPAGPFTFAVTTGTLPAGLTLTAAGALTGTPTTAAASTFTVTATSPANLTGNRAYTLTVTTPPPPAATPILVGGLLNGTAAVFNPVNNAYQTGASKTFAGFPRNVRTATADVNNDGVPDFIGGSGPGSVNVIAVIDGKTGATLVSFSPFETAFAGGLFVAVADMNRDGFADVIVTPDQGGGPIVAIYSGKSFAAGTGGEAAQLDRFFGIDDPAFRGGARAAAGDVNGDKTPDLVVSAGFGGGPRIAIFDGSDIAPGRTPRKFVGDFLAFEERLRNGAFVTVGDMTNDGKAELVFGGGPNGAPRVRIFDGSKLLAAGAFTNLDAVATQSQISDFFAGNSSLRGGVHLAIGNVDGDGRADLITSSGDNETSAVRLYRATTILANAASPSPDQTFDPFGAILANGVFVG